MLIKLEQLGNSCKVCIEKKTLISESFFHFEKKLEIFIAGFLLSFNSTFIAEVNTIDTEA